MKFTDWLLVTLVIAIPLWFVFNTVGIIIVCSILALVSLVVYVVQDAKLRK